MAQTIFLNIGDLVVSNHVDDRLTTLSVGSCVTLVLFDSDTSSVAMSHIALPDSAASPVPEANPNLDSDQDGLTDAEELNIYQTNPLQADSDGDGYTDGDEVRAGYNPLGSGKLAQ